MISYRYAVCLDDMVCLGYMQLNMWSWHTDKHAIMCWDMRHNVCWRCNYDASMQHRFAPLHRIDEDKTAHQCIQARRTTGDNGAVGVHVTAAALVRRHRHAAVLAHVGARVLGRQHCHSHATSVCTY